MTELTRIRRALISVSDKSGLHELASSLAGFGVEIVSTGGTARFLREAGITVRDVSEVTGFPEMMDGRVKTLHPKVHGALLARRDDPAHVASMEEHDIEPIDLVVVNLYPFEQTIAKDGVTLEEAVENIDIGGPAMIRSAAKNWRDVAVVTDAQIYPEIIDELQKHNGALSMETRARLAALAFTRTASYDRAISAFLSEQAAAPVRSSEPPASASGGFPNDKNIQLAKVIDLRYGENPHQRAALYTTDNSGIANAGHLHGKEMSFNNYVDADAAWQLVNDFDDLAVAIIKHTNPCGVGLGTTNEEGYRRALAADPVSAFGSIVAFNRKVDADAAKAVIDVFSEVIVAPDYDEHAIEVFKTKRNLRVLKGGNASVNERASSADGTLLDSRVSACNRGLEYKQITGGFLVQDKDIHQLTVAAFNMVTTRKPTDSEIKAMLFAWTVCRHVKSNAIVFANEQQTLGVGAGQMNRVDSVRIAAMRAERFGLSLQGSVLASDAFFPFRDNVDEAAKLGVSAIIQPGGSVKDDESIAAANEHGIAMAFTGIRHFRH